MVAGSYPYLQGVGPPPTPTPPHTIDLPDGPGTGRRHLPSGYLPDGPGTGGQLPASRLPALRASNWWATPARPSPALTGQQLVGKHLPGHHLPTGQQLSAISASRSSAGGQVFIGAGCRCPAGTIDLCGRLQDSQHRAGTDSATVHLLPGDGGTGCVASGSCAINYQYG